MAVVFESAEAAPATSPNTSGSGVVFEPPGEQPEEKRSLDTGFLRGAERGGRAGLAFIKSIPSAIELDTLSGRLNQTRQELAALEQAPDESRADLPVQATGMGGMRDRRKATLIKQLQQDESVRRDVVALFRQYQREQQEAGKGGVELTDVIGGDARFLEWLGGAVGQGAAVMVPLVLAGLVPAVGPALATAGAVTMNRADIVGQRAEDSTLYGMPGLARPSAIEGAMQDPQRLTEKIGSEQGAIGAATAGYSALDFFLGPVGKVISGRMGRKGAQEALAEMSKSQMIRDILKETGKQSVEEFINEGGQEGISVLMEALLDAGEVDAAAAAKRMFNAAAAGAATGGPFGGGLRVGEHISASKGRDEAAKVGQEAAGVSKAAGKKSGIDLSQLAAVTDEKGNTAYDTPSGERITKERWDNAGRRMREAWLTPGENVPRETAAPQQTVVAGVRVDEEIEAAPAPDEVADEELTAAAPPKSERVQELERLAFEAETPEARKTLEQQAKTAAKKEEDEFRRIGEADDLMALARKTKDEEIAAGLRERGLKLRGAEPKPEAEKPAVRGLRAREETVEQVEAKPIKEPTTAKELEQPGSMKKISAAEENMIESAARKRDEALNEATLTEARALGIETEGRPIAEVESALRTALDNDWTKTYGLPLDSIENASIARRASDIDEQATQDAAVRYGDDEAGFIRAAQEIIDANQEREPTGRREGAQPTPDQAAGRRAAGEGKPQAAAAEPGRQAPVRGEQRLRVTEPDKRAQSEQKQSGAGRTAPAGGVERFAKGWDRIEAGDAGWPTQGVKSVPAKSDSRAAKTLHEVRDSLRERFKLTPEDFDMQLVEQPTAPANRVASAIAQKIFNVQLHWFAQSGQALTAGFRTQRNGGGIFLEVNRTPYPAMAVTGHELLHQMRAEQPEIYNDLVLALMPQIVNLEKFRGELGSIYTNKQGELPTYDKAIEELIGDIVGDRFTEPEFWAEVMLANPGRFEKIAHAVIKFLNEVIAKVSKIRPFGTEQYLQDLRKARTAVAQALDKFHAGIAKERDLTESVQRAQESLSLNPDENAAKRSIEELTAAGADAKKLADHKDAIDAKIKEFLGERAFTWMESNGLLRPMWSWDDEGPSARDREVPAFVEDRTGQARAVFYYDRIEDVSRVPELLLHEIGTHFGLRRMLGEEAHKTLLDEIVALKKDGSPAFVEAWRTVKRDYIDERGRPFFDEGSEAFLDEVAAAVVQTHPKDSFVKRLLAQVRAWVHQNITPRLAGKMDETLLKGLAVAALRKAGRGELSTESLTGLRRSTSSADDSVAQVMMARPGRTSPPRSVSTTHASVVEKWLDFFNRHFLDSFSQLKKRQLQKVPGQLRDQLNAFAREQLMHGRATERLKDINTDYLAPMIKIAGEAELTREDVSDGLYAIHAPEANAYIASINPQQPDGGSGLTNRAAAQILASYTPAQRRALDRISNIVQRMNRAKLDRMVTEGLITPQQRTDMQQRYTHWLSLKQMDDEETFGLSGPGLSVKGREFQARMGRYSQAEDPLSMTIRDAMYAVMRAEKNRVSQTFYNFVKANPDQTLWEEITPANYPTQRILDAQTGQVRMVPDPLSLWREPEYFGAKVAGEQKWIRIKDPLLAEQMKKLGDHGLESDNELIHAIVKGLNTATRLLSRFYTQLSVDFMLVNPIRDVQHGLLVATSLDKAKGKELAARMFMNLPAALRDAAVANFQEAFGKHPGGLYEQFRQDGGTTGGFGLDDAKTIQREMERALAALNGDAKAKAAMGVHTMLKPIMALNDSFENMSRFAVYKAGLESGFTREQSAVMAKNVTVNFNKRGQATPVFNALWAFFNAAMQANVVAVRAVMRSRIAQVASAGLFAAGAYAALADDEDERGIDESERVSEFVLDRNLVFPFGDKKAVKVPLAYGFNIPYAAGRHLVRVLQNKESAGHMLGSIAKLGFTTFLPTDSPVPTVAQPVIDVVTGTDFAGRRIAKENPFDAVTPKSSQYKENANAAAVAFFKALNAATGGTEFTKGGIDVSPEKATYLIKQYLGGLAAPLELAALPFAEKATVADVPVARRFIAEAKEDIYITKAARIIREAEARRKEIESGAEEAKPGEEEFVQTVRAYESALRRLSAARNRMLREDKKADVSEIDAERNLLADQVLTARKAFQQEAR